MALLIKFKAGHLRLLSKKGDNHMEEEAHADPSVLQQDGIEAQMRKIQLQRAIQAKH